jgi:fibronectin type 3 domain-containing protein
MKVTKLAIQARAGGLCLCSALLLLTGCANSLLQDGRAQQAKAISPTISVKGGDGAAVSNGANIDLGTLSINGSKDTTLTVSNGGKTALTISACGLSVTSGTSANFALSQAPASTVASGASTTLTLHFAATDVGGKTATLNIATNDVSTPTYTVNFQASVTTAPTGFSVDAGNGCVNLSWNVVVGASSYTIYHSTTAGVTKANGVPIPGITATSYSHTGLNNGTTYYYIVTATIGGVEYDPSAQVSATPVNCTSPPQGITINNLSPTTAGKGNVQLSWTAPSTGTASSYVVYQSTNSAVSKAIYAHRYTGITGTSYTDAAATPGAANYYLITAVNGAGESLNSSVVSIMVQPDPPSSFTAAGGSLKVGLTWTAATGAASYTIYRSTSSGFTPGSGNLLASGVSGTSYTDTTTAGDTTYYYDIKAVDAAGASLAYGNISALSLSNDATLSDLSVSVGGQSGTLSPAFSSATTSYTVSLPWNSGTAMTVTGTAYQAHASVSNPGAITLTNSGIVTTPINVVGTAQDGTTTKTYTITAVYQKTFAFVVNYNDSTVWSYTQDPSTGLLTKINSYPTGSNPVTVAVTPNNKYLYTANFGANSISAFSINADATLTAIATYSTVSGYAPFDLKISPNGKFLFTNNTNGNTGYVSSWVINSANGTLSSATSNFSTGEYGPSCPCQMAVSADSAHVYTVPYYYSPYQSKFDVNQSTGVLSALVSTNWSGLMLALAIHPSGKTLYVTRGDASGGWSQIYNAPVDTSTGAVQNWTNNFGTSNIWPVKAIVDPLGRCLFYFCDNSLDYARINQATYLTEQSNNGTGVGGDNNNYNRPCFDPTDSYLYNIHGSGNDISVHPISWAYSSPYYTPTLTTNGTTVTTGSNPWQMAVARQPGY